MAVHPFGMWHVGDTFYQAVDLEDEEDDQYEEEEEDEASNMFEVICEGDGGVVSGDVLVVCVGVPANMFVETFTDIPNQCVAQVVNRKKQQQQQQQQDNYLLYQMGKAIVCVSKTSVEAENALKWIECVLSQVQVKSVVVLSSQTKTSFHGDVDAKNSDADVLRHLRTSSVDARKNWVAPLLEHGTILSDLPAAIISYCEMSCIPAVLYVNFTESHFIDVFTLKTLQVVLKDPLLVTLPQPSKSVLTSRLRNFEGVGVADNNLYI